MNMLHYAVPPPEPSVDPFIRGVGECAWCVPNGLEQYSGLALAGRLADVAYYAGWVSAEVIAAAAAAACDSFCILLAGLDELLAELPSR